MTKPVLIVGGYGVVGYQLAQIVRNAHPDLCLYIGGRTRSRAENAAAKLGNAKGVVINATAIDPLSTINHDMSAVIVLVNEHENVLLRGTIKRGIPYIDITRWTERLKKAIYLASLLEIKAPVSLSSSWMAGVSALVTKSAVSPLTEVDSIQTSILLRLQDKSGPNSIEYAERLAIPFRTMKGKQWVWQKPMRCSRKVTFPSGYVGKSFQFDEPSQETLAIYTNADTVISRMSLDHRSINRLMAFLVQSGVWKLISGPSFRKLRHFLLHNPKAVGAAHEISITAEGRNATKTPTKVHTTIRDAKGQAHLTALGAYIQLQETLGLCGRPARPPGIYLPENHIDPTYGIEVLKAHGVEISIGINTICSPA